MPDAKSPMPTPRTRRWTIARRVIAGTVVVVLAAAFFARNALLYRIVEPAIAAATGGQCTIEGARWTSLNSIAFDDVHLEVDGWEGPAKEVLHLRGLEAHLRLLPLLTGTIIIDRLEIAEATVRISERLGRPGKVNLAALHPEGTDEVEGTPTHLGFIDIKQLTIDVGVSHGDAYASKSIDRFKLRIEPIGAEDALHSFLMTQLSEDNESSALIKGWWNPRTLAFDVRVDDLDLGSGSALAMSASVRAFCNRIDLRGHLDFATLSWRVGETPHAELNLTEVGFTMPSELGLDAEWVRLEGGRISKERPPLPRMEVREGRIEVDGDRIALRGFIGSLVPSNGDLRVTPIKIRLEADARLVAAKGDRPAGPKTLANFTDWGEGVLASAPFELEVTISEFMQRPLDKTEEFGIADLPRPIAHALANLQAVEWNLAAGLKARRGSLEDPTQEPSAQVNTSAEIFLAGGRGSYHRFPYPLRNVRARVVAENDQVFIEHLTALGPSGHELRIDGALDGSGPETGVHLRIQSAQIPLDHVLLAALPPRTRRAVEQLFDSLAEERLGAAGLLQSEASVAAARERSDILRAQSNAAELSGDIQSIDRHADELQRMEAIVAAGPFQLGGLAALDFNVDRAPGPDQPVIVEGTLDLDRVGVIYDEFPYPLIATHGQLQIQRDAIVVPDPGIAITTPAGGTGRITGRVDLPSNDEGGRDAHPRLSIVLANDRLNPALLAAVPPEAAAESDATATAETVEGWPGVVHAEAIRPLIELGVGGPFDCHASIRTRHDGRTDVRAAIVLRNGHVIPPVELTRTTEAGKAWPRGLALESCDAVLLIEPEEISLRSFVGHRGDGAVVASGSFDRLLTSGEGRVEFDQFRIEPYMLELVPEKLRKEATELHSSWRPKGSIDALIVWDHHDGVDTARVTVEPNMLSFTSHDRSQTLLRESGSIVLVDQTLHLNEIVMRDEDVGSQLAVNGSLDWSGPTPTHAFDASIADLAVGSPIVSETLRLSAGDAFAAVWRARAPEGVVHGNVTLRSQETDAVRVNLMLDAFTMLADPAVPASRGGGTLDPPGRLLYTDGDMAIGPLLLRGEGDTVLELEGHATTLAETIAIDLAWRLAASTSKVPETGFLPPPFGFVLTDEALTTGAFNAQGSVHLSLGVDPERLSAFQSDTHLAFANGAVVLGGLNLDHIAGTSSHHLRVENDTIVELSGESSFPEAWIENRRLENIVVRTSLAPPSGDGVAIDLALGRGDLYDGHVHGRLQYAPESGRYELECQMADVRLAGLAAGEQENPEAAAEATPAPGRVLASLALKGVRGDDLSPIGRGEIEIREADIAGASNSLALLRIGQLMLPGDKGMSRATVSFLIDGGEAILSRILLDSATLGLGGSGRLRLSDFSIAARLLPKGRLGPISDLVSAISGTVYAVDIQGPLTDPEVRLTPLPLMVSAPEIAPDSDHENQPQE